MGLARCTAWRVGRRRARCGHAAHVAWCISPRPRSSWPVRLDTLNGRNKRYAADRRRRPQWPSRVDSCPSLEPGRTL